jgi:glycosyltransferase involved in cell wall biosynthesis
MRPLPTLNIVVPNLNYGHFIEQTLESIQSEYIVPSVMVIDGLSRDNSITKLIECRKPNLSWISCGDSGPAQAINTGFMQTSSDIIGWINSDDYYSAGSIDRALKAFAQNSDLMMVYGFGQHVDEFGEKLNRYPTKSPDVGIKAFQDGCFICQPTVFFRRSAIKDLGLLDEGLKTAFDFEYWVRFFKKYGPKRIKCINQVQAYSRIHAQCITVRSRELVSIEAMQIIANNIGDVPVHWALTYINELFSQYPFVNRSDSLIDGVNTYLAKVERYFSKREFKQLLERIQNDARLKLSSHQLYVEVMPDGWVSQKLIVKLRHCPNEAHIVELKCAVGWPKTLAKERISLQIRSSDGSVEKVQLSGDDEFFLKLEAPECTSESHSAWVIETKQFFIPAVTSKRSTDGRKLSFRVEQCAVI